MNVHEVHTVEVLVPKRNFGGSSNLVPNVGRSTHPRRVSIVPHGHI